jgi:amidase
MHAMDATELAFAGIARQAEMIAAGEVSSRELVELYLKRIERFNPQLGAFRIVLAQRALMEADQADARRRAGSPSTERGGGVGRPLLGVPIAVKDEFDVAGEVTTFGTNAYGEPAREDSEIVRRARAAGAIVIGKTHMPELGAVPWTESPTWGVTRNPWRLEHSPGGSSGGSAAAVAAGLVGAALAGDGGGSIRFPAAYCGLFGLKTQRGRVPLAPHLGAWHGLVVNGVLARSVHDTALFYDAIADGPSDPGAASVPSSSFLEALGRTGVHAPEGSSSSSPDGGQATRPLRIAVANRLPPSPLTRLHPENRAALDETVALLRRLGHEVEEREIDYGPMAPPPEFTAIYLRSIHEEAATFAYPERLERRIRALARLGGMLPSGAVDWALGRQAEYAARLNQPLADHDVLLMPVTPAPAPRIGAREGWGWLRTTIAASATVPYAAPWNFTGQPACSVPAGFAADGLPRAVQFVGKPNDEATLLSLSAQLEAERPWAQHRPAAFS